MQYMLLMAAAHLPAPPTTETATIISQTGGHGPEAIGTCVMPGNRVEAPALVTRATTVGATGLHS